jgi:hypothetical protein
MSARQGYGQRRIHVSTVLLEKFFTGNARIRTDLPKDARLVRMYPSEDGAVYIMIFESEEWDELYEAEIIPKIECTVTNEPISIVVDK